MLSGEDNWPLRTLLLGSVAVQRDVAVYTAALLFTALMAVPFYFVGWAGPSSPVGVLYQPRMIVKWNENWQGKPKYSEKTCLNDILSTTNPPISAET
jgi:hypothetical protein